MRASAKVTHRLLGEGRRNAVEGSSSCMRLAPSTDAPGFHGRIIDSLGLQVYQGPVAVIADLIANSWDADASLVDVLLPVSLSSGAPLSVKDDGEAMTFEECQDRYLNVGRNRRVEDSTSFK